MRGPRATVRRGPESPLQADSTEGHAGGSGSTGRELRTISRNTRKNAERQIQIMRDKRAYLFKTQPSQNVKI